MQQGKQKMGRSTGRRARSAIGLACVAAVMIASAGTAYADDGPVFTSIEVPDPEQVAWFAVNEVVPTSMPATSLTHGVKRIEFTAQEGSGPEVVLGYVEDPCAGTPLDPCPTELGTDPIDVDWSLLDEGRYTVRLRAIDGASNETMYPATIAIDRTAPDLDPLTGPLAALDGLTTNSSATLALGVPASEVTDGVAVSGLQYVNVHDDLSWYSETLDCAVDDCDDPEFDVPLGTWGNGTRTFTATAVDLASNSSERQITVTISRP